MRGRDANTAGDTGTPVERTRASRMPLPNARSYLVGETRRTRAVLTSPAPTFGEKRLPARVGQTCTFALARAVQRRVLSRRASLLISVVCEFDVSALPAGVLSRESGSRLISEHAGPFVFHALPCALYTTSAALRRDLHSVELAIRGASLLRPMGPGPCSEESDLLRVDSAEQPVLFVVRACG